MRCAKFLTLVYLGCLPLAASAQAIDNTTSVRNLSSDRYFRLDYENDVVTKTDYYYTQGIYIELVSPGLRGFPLSKLLLHPAGDALKSGIALEHDVYTPTDFVAPQILYGDRPFCAALFLKTFATATDTVRNSRLSSSLSAGIIGPGAGGQEMQTFIHAHTGNDAPHGWTHQVNNDAVLNYEVCYQRQLIGHSRYFSLSADGMARAGTLSDKAQTGITVMAGLLRTPFAATTTPGSKFQLYVYDQPQVSAVAYDATLQGGVFDHNNEYVINARDLTRSVFRNSWGFVLQFRKVYLEYFQSYTTKEFRTGLEHHNGGVQLGVGF